MAKNYSKVKFTKKSLIAALCALSVTCTGLAAACSTDGDDNKTSTPSREDSSLLKNGSFEYFDIPDDAVYLIKNVKDWSLGGESSVKSGIIGTSEKDWNALSAADLADKLEYNYDLGTSHDDYIDYNSMRQRDVLYKDPYAAMLSKDDVKDSLISHQGYEEYFGIKDGKYNGKTVYKNEDDGEYYFDAEFTQNIRQEVISNPETHYGKYSEKDGKYYLGTTEVYKDDDGNIFSDKDKKNPAGNVLMVHNYSTDGKYNGIQQYYTSETVTLEANTAAEISLWVKTSDLKFDKGYNALEEQDKGAFIEVVQTVGGNSVDAFAIKNINTEKILNYASKDGAETTESNGWLNYKIYVNACDFASSTVQLRLGLGRDGDAEKCTGYAFFDDVTVTKYRDLQDSSYKDNSAKTQTTFCTLTSEADDKIFNADKEMRDPAGNSSDFNNAYDFHYLIDLASETDKTVGYNAVKLDRDNVNAALTTAKANGKVYATSTNNKAQKIDVGSTDQTENYDLVKNKESRPTENDIIGTFAANADFALFSGKDKDYSKLLKDALTGDKGISKLPKYDETDSNMLVMLSSYGAAYTSTIQNVPAFDLSKSAGNTKDRYLVVSFWIKTSDMSGKSAATVSIYDVADTDKENAQTLTIDTTGVTSDFDKEKDIYNGWVQCFFFVKNGTKFDSDASADNTKKFNVDLTFGNTDVQNATSYDGGWVALANLQTLEIDEEIYKLATSGTYTALFSFDGDEDDNGGNKLDEAHSTSDIKTGIATPSTYNGLNGANSAVSGADSNPAYDAHNTHTLAGLINKDYASAYTEILGTLKTSFNAATASWSDVFGDDCYQPLIIINNLRTYADNVTATKDTYTKYFIEADDEYVGDFVEVDGKKYRTAEGTEWDEEQTYYALNKVCNYGFAGENKTVSADSYTTVSVKVKVSSGAKAYIYLVDSDNPKNVLSYTTPAYTFWYDGEGNVLDEEFDEDWKEKEHREHIVYTLRNDGLYDGKDGKVYANLHNLIKSYRNYKFEHNTFYNEEGKPVSFDNLVNGETYYNSADKSTRVVADHYLVNSDNKRLYECVDGKYYYLEEGKRTTEVNNFDEKTYARYDHEALKKEYAVEVSDTNGEWKTVNFHIHTGSEALNYRLELWSGERNETGVDKDGNFANGAVAFDYSSYSLSSDTYSTVISQYENNVIDAYKELLKDHTDVWANENIAYYEEQAQKLVDGGQLAQADLDAVKATYGANYYTYTLYDSAAYVPFNANTAEDRETGYDYNASDFGEVLAYFTCEDEEQNSVNVFADYSAVDQSISLNTNSDDDDDTDDDENNTSGDVWLYVSSIILVVVLLATLVAILVKDALKKKRVSKGAKNRSKNVYRQRDRYIRKLHLVKNEEEHETAEPAEEASAEEESAVEEVPAEDTSAPVEEPAEEAPVEESAEESNEEVTEETPSEDNGENN